MSCLHHASSIVLLSVEAFPAVEL